MARNNVITDIEESVNLKRSIQNLERDRDSMLGELAQQAAEIRAVEDDLQKVESDKATLLENFNGNLPKYNSFFLLFCMEMKKRIVPLFV